MNTANVTRPVGNIHADFNAFLQALTRTEPPSVSTRPRAGLPVGILLHSDEVDSTAFARSLMVQSAFPISSGTRGYVEIGSGTLASVVKTKLFNDLRLSNADTSDATKTSIEFTFERFLQSAESNSVTEACTYLETMRADDDIVDILGGAAARGGGGAASENALLFLSTLLASKFATFRESAAFGLSALADPRAISALETARAKESLQSLQSLYAQVVAQFS